MACRRVNSPHTCIKKQQALKEQFYFILQELDLSNHS